MDGRWLTDWAGPSGWDPAEEVLATGVEVDAVEVDGVGVEVIGLLADGWEAPERVPCWGFLALGTLVDLGGGIMSLAVFPGDEEGELAAEEEAVGVPLLLPLLELPLLEEEEDLGCFCPFLTTLVIFLPANVILDLACEEETRLLLIHWEVTGIEHLQGPGQASSSFWVSLQSIKILSK